MLVTKPVVIKEQRRKMRLPPMCRRNYQIICTETEGTIFVFCREEDYTQARQGLCLQVSLLLQLNWVDNRRVTL